MQANIVTVMNSPAINPVRNPFPDLAKPCHGLSVTKVVSESDAKSVVMIRMPATKCAQCSGDIDSSAGPATMIHRTSRIRRRAAPRASASEIPAVVCSFIPRFRARRGGLLETGTCRNTRTP